MSSCAFVVSMSWYDFEEALRRLFCVSWEIWEMVRPSKVCVRKVEEVLWEKRGVVLAREILKAEHASAY